MTTCMYCLYVGVDYTYIDVNALAQGIKSFFATQVRFQTVAGARTYGTYVYVCMYIYMFVCMYECMFVCMYVYVCVRVCMCMYVGVWGWGYLLL